MHIFVDTSVLLFILQFKSSNRHQTDGLRCWVQMFRKIESKHSNLLNSWGQWVMICMIGLWNSGRCSVWHILTIYQNWEKVKVKEIAHCTKGCWTTWDVERAFASQLDDVDTAPELGSTCHINQLHPLQIGKLLIGLNIPELNWTVLPARRACSTNAVIFI